MRLVAISKNKTTSFPVTQRDFAQTSDFFFQKCREFVERSQPEETDIPALELRVTAAELTNPVKAVFLFRLTNYAAKREVDPQEDADQSSFKLIMLDERKPTTARPPRHTTLAFAKVQLWA